MAKCSICNSRKGKRKCKAADSFICSSCCGETRSNEKCDGCSFYIESEQKRNYSNVPRYPVNKVANDLELQDNADVVESAICQFDEELNRTINDNIALRLTELLLDRYYFNDKEIKFKTKLEENGFDLINKAIQKEINVLSVQDPAKLIGTIYHSIKRHTKGNREYIEFIHQHVGIRIGKGIRAIPDFISKSK